ncbi:MAG: hypothetical protein RMI91_02795 [Gemmatales bacterium]|nr:hypothetical protein [Gemmatales bacterium]MDW7993556.1 hypothetical protein [Gemmatales bacterium]
MLEVQGTVFYRGQPVRQGVVAFKSDPQRNPNKILAVGIIQADGQFTLRREDGSGIPPGWYQVSVLSLGEPRLPERYSDPDRSGIICQILPSSAKTLCVQLE